MKNKVYFRNKGYLLRVLSEMATFNGVLFLFVDLLSIFLFSIQTTLVLTFVLFLFLLSAIIRSINYIESIEFYDDKIILNVLHFYKRNDTIIKREVVEVEKFGTSIGIAGLVGYYYVFYENRRKIFKQYQIDGWKDSHSIEALRLEVTFKN